MFTLKPKRGNNIPEEELNTLYEELRPIVFRLAEKCIENDIINLNFEVGSVTFKFHQTKDSDNFEWDADGWLKYSDSFGTIEIVPKR